MLLTSADPDGELVAAVLGHLIAEPDAVARWQAVNALAERRLNWVRQLCVAQLAAEGMSLREIGERLGISKTRAAQLQSGRTYSPANAWGRQVAVYGLIAGAAGRVARGEYEKLEPMALSTTTVRPRLHEASLRWLRRVSEDERAGFEGRLAELAADADQLPSGHMSLDQRFDAMVGHGSETHQARTVSAASGS
jgi:transcriptional regulator with XRE-family HTH domain